MSKSSISLWARDIPHPTTAEQNYDARQAGAKRYFDVRRRRVFIETQNEKLAWAHRIGPINDRELLIAGAVAYWAEGSKSKPWRRDESVAFINSDADMVRLFLRWLRAVGIDVDRCSFRLQIHETADVEAAQGYWAEALGLGPERFGRATLKRHQPRTVRHNTGLDYHGCLVVRVYQGAETDRRIEGIWWAVKRSSQGTQPVLEACGASRVPVVELPMGLHPRLARFRRILRQGTRSVREADTV